MRTFLLGLRCNARKIFHLNTIFRMVEVGGWLAETISVLNYGSQYFNKINEKNCNTMKIYENKILEKFKN